MRDGSQTVIGWSTTLRAEDNPTFGGSAGSSLALLNRLSFGFTRENSTSRFDLDVTGAFDAINYSDAASVSEFTGPTARVAFSTQGTDLILRATANYAETTIDTITGLTFSEDEGLGFEFGEGSVVRTGATLALIYGEDLPFGAAFNLKFDDRDYTDTIDPDYFDRTSTTGSLDLHFQVSPNISIKPYYSVTDYDADDLSGTSTLTTRFGVDSDLVVSDVLAFEVGVGTTRIDRTTTAPALTSETSNTVWSVAAQRDVPDGSHRVSLKRELANAGPRTTLTYNHDIELPVAALSYGIGLTRRANGGDVVVASLSYSLPLPEGIVTAGLTREVVTDADGDEELTSNFSASYSRQVNESSSLTFSLNGAELSDDTTQYALGASYSRALTSDWNLTAGVQHRSITEVGSDRETSNAIYVTVNRQWIARQ